MHLLTPFIALLPTNAYKERCCLPIVGLFDEGRAHWRGPTFAALLPKAPLCYPFLALLFWQWSECSFSGFFWPPSWIIICLEFVNSQDCAVPAPPSPKTTILPQNRHSAFSVSTASIAPSPNRRPCSKPVVANRKMRVFCHWPKEQQRRRGGRRQG